MAISIILGLLFAIIFPLMIFLPVATGYYLSSKNRKHKRLFEFDLTQEMLSLSAGPSYPLADISNVAIRNKQGEYVNVNSYSETHVWGGGMVGAASNVGAQAMNLSGALGRTAGQAISASLEKRGYSLGATYGREEVVLADHMDEFQAQGLFAAITEPRAPELRKAG